jgi:proteasome-associated ATPase
MASTEELNELLDEAKQTIMLMDAELTRLKSAPLVYATVVKADNKFRLDNFEKGDPMVVLDREINKDKHKQFGRISSDGADDDGWIILEFPAGGRERLNIGLTGKPQVKLVGKDDGINVVIALSGLLYEVHGLPDKALQPAEQVKVDMESRQIHDTTGISSGGEVAYVKGVIDDGDDLPTAVEFEADTTPKTEKPKGIFGFLRKQKRRTTVEEKATTFAEQELEATADTDAPNPNQEVSQTEVPEETEDVYIEARIPHVEVESQGRNRIVLHGKPDEPLEAGDRVMLDQSSTIIVRVLERADKGSFTMTEPSPTTWSDIAGCDEVRETLEDLIVLPFTSKDHFEYYRKTLPKGGMIYGPPGCGKTMSAKAVSNRFAEIHGAENFQSGFIYVKGPELLHWHVGRTEDMIRQLFARGREHHKLHGYPALLFIDEADALLPMRGSGKSSDVENTIVPMFLGEMDGLEESHVFVLLATNQPRRLDPAVVREGRCERHIKVGRPTERTAGEYFDIHLRDVPWADGQDYEEVVAVTTADLFAGHRRLYDVSSKSQPGQQMAFNLGHTVTGAMIKGLCEQATAVAMRRDIAANTKTGVHIDDFRLAVEQTYEQHKDLNPTFDLEDFCDDNNISRNDAVINKACSA